MNKLKNLIAVVALVGMVFMGCAAWNTGTAHRLVATVVANELGIEFAEANPELAASAVVYIETTERLAQTPFGYRDAIELGVNELMEILDDERKARLQPVMKELLNELAIEIEIEDKIKIPDEIDTKMLRALVSGFRSGIEYQLGR